MKCPNCGGTGKYKNGFGKVGTCYYCLGTGKVSDKGERVKTEQEYLQTCNTEQLAEWLCGVYWHCHEIDCEHCNYPWRCMEKGDIVEWLKQPHLTSK